MEKEKNEVVNEGLRIVKFRAENIKRIKAIDVTPDPNGNLVLFTGRNGQGKTSILDHIMYGLGGEGLIPDSPIRKGEEKATETIDLGEYKITRTFTHKGSYLKVVSSDGGKYGQKLLDGFVNDLSFNPLEFVNMGKKKQRDVLLKLVDLGIDLDEIARKRKELYEERKLVNKELKRQEATLKSLGKPDSEYIREEISLIALLGKLEEANDTNSSNREERSNLGILERGVTDLKDELDELKNKILAVEGRLAQRTNMVLNQKKVVDGLKDVDSLEIKSQINGAEETNLRIRTAQTAAKYIRKINKEIKESTAKSNSCSSKIDQIELKKDNAVQNAQFPIEGLSVDENGVLFKGFPFDQAGGGEKMEVSFAILAALNPRLRIVLIDEIGYLDSEMLNKVVALAKENNFQIWATKVDETGKVGIVIEDGEVVSVNDNMSISDTP